MKFNLEGKYFLKLKKVGDMVLLQLAFLITALPVVTIGAGITALYSVSRKMRRDSLSLTLQSYFSYFKENFKKSTIAWLLLLAAIALLFLDYLYYTELASSFAPAIAIIFIVLAFLTCSVFIYIFPLIAWFENGLKTHLKNALVLSVGHLGRTVLAVVILIAFAALAILALPLFAFFGFSGLVYSLSALLSGVLLPDEGKDEDEDENEDENIDSD